MEGRLARIAGPVDRVVHAEGVPGAGIAVLAGGEVAVEHYAGDAGPGNPAGPETRWPIASISKLYTATMIMRLAEMPTDATRRECAEIAQVYERTCDPVIAAFRAEIVKMIAADDQHLLARTVPLTEPAL
jgi:hypothetical protein